MLQLDTLASMALKIFAVELLLVIFLIVDLEVIKMFMGKKFLKSASDGKKSSSVLGTAEYVIDMLSFRASALRTSSHVVEILMRLIAILNVILVLSLIVYSVLTPEVTMKDSMKLKSSSLDIDQPLDLSKPIARSVDIPTV